MPDPAGVVFTACRKITQITDVWLRLWITVTQVRVIACDDGVSLVVKSAGEDLIRMSLQHLPARSRVHAPHTSRLIHARRQNTAPLRIKTHLEGGNTNTLHFWLSYYNLFIIKQLLFVLHVEHPISTSRRRREEKERERAAELNLTRVSMTGVLERCMSVLELSPLYRKWK